MIKKKDLIALLSKHSGVPQIHIKPVIDILGEALTEILASGEEVIITDFGRFCAIDKKTRGGFDPTRKEAIVIPGHKSAKFKPCKMLKRALNQNDDE